MDATLTTAAPGAAPTMLPRTPTHPRLAELVVHLTGCAAPLAVAAVDRAAARHEPHGQDDLLALVAEAMVAVKRIDLRDRRASS